MQTPDEEKRRRAHFVVDSSGSYDGITYTDAASCVPAVPTARAGQDRARLDKVAIRNEARMDVMTRMTCRHCRSSFPAARPDLAGHCCNACRSAAYGLWQRATLRKQKAKPRRSKPSSI